MNHRITIFIYLFLSPALLAQPCQPPVANQRDLIILPDTAGEESIELLGKNAVNLFQSGHLEIALLSQAAPILVELSIWKRFARIVKQKAIKRLPALDYQYYIINNYMLCIPLAAQNATTATSFNLTQAQLIQKPYNLMPSLLDPLKGWAKATLTLIELYSSIVKTLQQLIGGSKKDGINWNIILFGHGGPTPLGSHTARIAGIPFNEFKRLLQFLKNSIKTNIFLYQTCYAGSKWLLKSYETSGTPDVYPFPIILTGISEAPVYSFSDYRDSVIIKNFFSKIKSTELCKENIQQLGAIAGVLLQAFTYKKIKNQLALTRPNNIIQIRWPNSRSFETIELEKLVQTASSLLSTPSTAPIPVESSAIVLDKPIIRQPLIFNKKEQHISSLVGQKWHYIQSIGITGSFNNSTTLMKQLFSYFTGMKNLKSQKVFIIDRVFSVSSPTIVAENVMIFISSPTPSSLFPIKDPMLYYQIGNNVYQWKFEAAKPEKLDLKKAQHYSAFYTKYKKKLL